MKVLYILTGLGVGGAEIQVVALADKMVELGHEVTLISLSGFSEIAPKSKEVEVFELGMVKTPFSMFKSYIKARRILKELNADVVHSHMVHANLFARFLRLTCRMKRLICTAHSTVEGGRLLNTLYRRTNFMGDVFTNVSYEAVREFEDKEIVAKNDMVCVYNGIDVDKFQHSYLKRSILRRKLGFTNEDFIFLAVGRLSNPKDYPNMLYAFTKIISRSDNVNLVIAGDGPLKNEIDRQVNDLSLSGRVTLLGLRKDVSDLMSAADAFILSSSYEGFGLVVAEALACQLPVVATDCGGVKEVVGDFGLLCRPKDSLALADAAIQLTEMPSELRGELSLAGREYVVERFSIDRVANKWIDLYFK